MVFLYRWFFLQALDDAKKEKIQPVLQLTADYMSSEELAEESGRQHEENTASSESENGEAQASSSQKKTLVKRMLTWRSRELQSVIESLDRKLDRCRSDRAKVMCLQFVVQGTSTSDWLKNYLHKACLCETVHVHVYCVRYCLVFYSWCVVLYHYSCILLLCCLYTDLINVCNLQAAK